MFDELVKNQKLTFPVIPAKAGIQEQQALLDPGFRRGDDLDAFLRKHHASLSPIHRLQQMHRRTVFNRILRVKDHSFYSRYASLGFGDAQMGEEIFHPRPIWNLHLKAFYRIIPWELLAQGAKQFDLHSHR